MSIFLLSACSSISMFSPFKTIDNPNCQRVKYFEVFEVLDDAVLTKACYGRTRRRVCLYHNLAYIKKEKDKVYFDGQKIRTPRNKCPVYYGTYFYIDRKDNTHTVPKVSFESDEIDNPEYIEWLEGKQEKENTQKSAQ